MSVTTLQAVPDTTRLIAASLPHVVLPRIVARTVDAEQMHRNVTRPAFLALHALTDDLAHDTRVSGAQAC